MRQPRAGVQRRRDRRSTRWSPGRLLHPRSLSIRLSRCRGPCRQDDPRRRLLVPVQKVVLDEDPQRARALARERLQVYWGFPNYTRNLARHGLRRRRPRRRWQRPADRCARGVGRCLEHCRRGSGCTSMRAPTTWRSTSSGARRTTPSWPGRHWRERCGDAAAAGLEDSQRRSELGGADPRRCRDRRRESSPKGDSRFAARQLAPGQQVKRASAS